MGVRWSCVRLSWLLVDGIYVEIFHARIERHRVFSGGVKGGAMGGRASEDGKVIKEAES